jgi:sugar phosphate permease
MDKIMLLKHHKDMNTPLKTKLSLSLWQNILLLSVVIGYALFYATRQNLTIVMPVLEMELGFTKEQMGWIFSIFSVVYGVGKLVNGFVADRYSPRLIFTVGLLGSSLACGLYTLSDNFFWFLGVASCSAWFQSMGWPPITKILTQWYPSSQLGAKWGVANTSHQFGSVLILAGGPYIMFSLGWSYVFIIPMLAGILVGVILFFVLKDTPEQVGLRPVIEPQKINSAPLSFFTVVKDYLLPNTRMWYVCLATFFLYIVRMGFFFWAPLFLKEVKGVTLIQAGWVTAGFELAGAFGGVIAGYISDRFFQKKRGLAGAIYMGVLLLFLFYFWASNGNNVVSLTMVTFCVGFFVYGSQVITGVLAADVVPPHIVSSAVGLTGTFGYLAGSIFSGVVIGHIAHHYGWHLCFMLFAVSAFLGTIFFLLTTLTSKK